jgi:2-polyprenyl-6-methoxyphenol hydroxylase-like FAD-dependent oxidoreductase
MTPSTTTVLIAGAGPTGLTLACELARRQIACRLIDAAPLPSSGSRGKGLQPRTLEVFDDLGIVKDVLADGAPYPRLRLHVWRASATVWGLERRLEPTSDVPYPNLWMLPQWRTEQILRDRLQELGGEAELGKPLTGFEQDGDGVSATVGSPANPERIRADYLVGCDGGHSFVRKALGVRLHGETLEGKRLVLADVDIEGLDRAAWHVWPLANGCILGLCPLPGTETFQMTAILRPSATLPELTEEGIRRFVRDRTVDRLHVRRARWISLYRPQVRMVDRYRVDRVFLAGDAAHVHPPAGGQGLNTGVQDAYNLAWKLAHVRRGAPAALLDSYEAERLPIAAAVLGLSKRLMLQTNRRRGSETKQLELHYRGSSLAEDAPDLKVGPTAGSAGKLCAGDRAPDALCEDRSGQSTRLFDAFRGPHFTLLAFGVRHAGAVTETNTRWSPVARAVRIVSSGDAGAPTDLVDHRGLARAAYGVSAEALVLVRPDGYVGLFATPGTVSQIDRYLNRTIGDCPAPVETRNLELTCRTAC